MKATEIMKGTGFEPVQGDDVDIKHLTIDSRRAMKGSMFFCIRGIKTDGHDYIQGAAEQRVSAVVIDSHVENLPSGLTVMRVRDTRKALALAASNFYGNPANSMNLLGVTGTNGKTSSTYFMESILRESGKKTGIIGTVEFRIGSERLNVNTATSTTPDTIELQQILSKMSAENVDSVVMEVTSHALALSKVDGLLFKAGIFTNLTQDHLDFHGTMENYRDTKAQFFSMCEHSIINADDANANFMIDKAAGKVVTFSIDSQSDLKAEKIVLLDNGAQFELQINSAAERFYIPVRGRFSVYNALGVIGAALALGISVETIKLGLANFGGVPGRIQSVQNDRGINVIVDYAHTPDGLQNIISSVREFTEGRLTTVFGCGGDRDKAKRPVMGRIAGELSDFCVLTSDNPRTENPDSILDEIETGIRQTACRYSKISDRRDAIAAAIEMAKKGDSVIIAGKGHENYQIFPEMTIHFDDREVAGEILNSL